MAADDNGSAADPSDEAAASDEPVGEVSRDDRAVEQPAKAPERVPASDESAAVGEVPSDILAAIVADAANHAGTAESEFSIVRSEQVVWNDGSLGCPEPGVYYTQATVSGYWVVLDLDGVQYDYRVRQNGLFRICSSPSSGPSTLNG
ncbi:MAG: hypothetical protein KJP22_12275 [Acidimicrobiia bacterium]|nr:hypothetical protein [Acidimicrobiia bacterium]